MSDIGVMILAAGASTRMGRPKQLLEYKGKTLLRRAAETAVQATCGPVVAVLGNYIRKCAAELDGLPVTIGVNRRWAAGMGSSVHCGVRALIDMSPGMEAVIITLCDQPLVQAHDLQGLITAFRERHADVCASKFKDSFGPPCLFARAMFEKLKSIDEQAGAKSLIEGNVAWIDCERAKTDIDTLQDWQNLDTAAWSL